MHFTKKQNNLAFLNLHIRPTVHFCRGRQYFLQEVFVRFYFLVKITRGQFSISLLVMRAFRFCFCYQTACYSR